MQEEFEAGWGSIVGDLLRCIVDKTSIRDRIRMSAVCRFWQNSLKDEKINFPICLMLSEKESSDKRSFNSNAEEVIIELDLPEIRGRRCWGTPFGWLVTFGLDLEIRLFNPLSKASLSLPSLRSFDNDFDYPPEDLRLYFIKKVFLSSSPTSPDCIAMAICGVSNRDETLVFAKPGDQVWTQICFIFSMDDITCFNGNFFVVLITGEVLICEDLNGPSPKLVEFAAPPSTVHLGHKKYIVDLGGDLCMITRGVGRYDIRYDSGRVERTDLTEEFEIFKLDMHTKNWEKILSLGEHSLFLGNCCTFSVLAANYPRCRANCIYFTDDNFYYYPQARVSDIGIYNCDNTKDINYINDYEVLDLRSTFSPPLWIKLGSH
ncbi:F-box/kelch-repeat protein At1g57790-like [Herrania umbratica]|uniref:F-box/kelch-repeat protein At1g57790-like n=1 Tax=Herrania umbratica TaxID=108875 RepID=A0A6J0ZZT5_9ROSI|nr:F-box/kelch-repeat protein At1g57790-like [Herrania umbratica]